MAKRELPEALKANAERLKKGEPLYKNKAKKDSTSTKKKGGEK